MSCPSERCSTCGRSVYCSIKDAPRIGVITRCGKQLAQPWESISLECTYWAGKGIGKGVFRFNGTAVKHHRGISSS